MFNEKHRAEELLKRGFEKTLPLSRSIFLLAKYYKYLNYTEAECNHNITNWLQKQILHVSFNKAVEQKEGIINAVYCGQYRFIDKISVKIYLEEMRLINKLGTKGERKIAFCLLYLSKIYADKDGIFYCNYDILEKLSGMQISQITEIIYKLENQDIIEVVARNMLRKSFHFMKNSVEHHKVYKHPNKYRMILPKVRKPIAVIDDVKTLEDEFIKIYKVCLIQYKFDSSIYFKRYIKNYKSEGDLEIL